MSITYEEALETLQAMFADPWTRDILDAVLRHQKGHMENTVDLILQHGTKDPAVLIQQLDAGIDPTQSALALDEQLARQLASAASANSSNSSNTRGSMLPLSSSGSGVSGGIGTPTVLPDDFLRIPNYRPSMSTNNVTGAVTGSGSGGSYTLSDDEALARMLQDELFTEELSRNPDFAHLAGGRGRTNRTGAASSTSRQNVTANAGLPGIPNPFAGLASRFNNTLGQNNNSSDNRNQQQSTPNNVNLIEKISEMGEGAKRRLQIMAAQFQAANANRMTNQQSGNSNQDETTGGYNSNNNRVGERRGLLDDHDDMELAARKDL